MATKLHVLILKVGLFYQQKIYTAKKIKNKLEEMAESKISNIISHKTNIIYKLYDTLDVFHTYLIHHGINKLYQT